MTNDITHLRVHTRLLQELGEYKPENVSEEAFVWRILSDYLRCKNTLENDRMLDDCDHCGHCGSTNIKWNGDRVRSVSIAGEHVKLIDFWHILSLFADKITDRIFDGEHGRQGPPRPLSQEELDELIKADHYTEARKSVG